MSKEEFEELVGTEIASEDFRVIHVVYSYHPSISGRGDEAKKQVVAIYEKFGMTVFYDMLGRAEKVLIYETSINEYKKKIADLKREIDVLGKGRCV
ncbi:MAG: hypothetical protein K2P87_12980 [Lachnospiraceae bacterium]|nr:hypothetical protein [Lachnospiraceae bacterium]